MKKFMFLICTLIAFAFSPGAHNSGEKVKSLDYNNIETSPNAELIAYVGWHEAHFRAMTSISGKLAKSPKSDRAFKARYATINKIAKTTMSRFAQIKNQIKSTEDMTVRARSGFVSTVDTYAAKQSGAITKALGPGKEKDGKLTAQASGTFCVSVMVDMEEACIETIRAMQSCGVYRNDPMQLKKDQDKCGEKAQTWFVICSDAVMTAGGAEDFDAFDFQEEVQRATENMMEMALQRCREAEDGGKKKKPKKKVTGSMGF